MLSGAIEKLSGFIWRHLQAPGIICSDLKSSVGCLSGTTCDVQFQRSGKYSFPGSWIPHVFIALLFISKVSDAHCVVLFGSRCFSLENSWISVVLVVWIGSFSFQNHGTFVFFSFFRSDRVALHPKFIRLVLFSGSDSGMCCSFRSGRVLVWG